MLPAFWLQSIDIPGQVSTDRGGIYIYIYANDPISPYFPDISFLIHHIATDCSLSLASL